MKPLNYLSLSLSAILAGCSSPTDTAGPKVPELRELWAASEGLETPESVLFDRTGDRIFVANMAGDQPGDGYISVLSPAGKLLDARFAAGLDDPKGMGLHGGQLYVADLTKVVVFSAETGELLNTYPVPGAEFLNDIAIDPFGVVYISDSVTDKIHKIENGYLRTLAESESFARPNGLFVVNPVTLLLGTSQGGEFGKVNFEEGRLDAWTDGIPSADGIGRDRFGNYIVSSWRGRIFYVLNDGTKHELLNTEEQEINTADIDVVPEDDLLLVPTFHDDRVLAFRLVYPD